jgi:hypothetical protein
LLVNNRTNGYPDFQTVPKRIRSQSNVAGASGRPGKPP